MSKELDANQPSPEEIAKLKRQVEYYRSIQPENELTAEEFDKAVDEIIKEEEERDRLKEEGKL